MMKPIKSCLSILIIGLLAIGLADTVDAQDRRAAVQTFNKALEFAKEGEYEQAINMYNQAINQAQQLGEEGADILEKSQNKLPEIYYQMALQNYKMYQKDRTLENINTTIDAFRQTNDIADEYGVDKIASRAGDVIPQLLYAKSILQYQQNNLQDAIATLDQVIEQNPNYAKAYYQKGIVTKNLDGSNLEEAIKLYDQAIEIGNKTNDNQVVTNAQQSARDNLIYAGSKQIEAKNFDQAVELLNRALEYDANSADAHYRLAEAYNKMQQWENAVNHAEEGVLNESGGRTEKARIYFELATAFKGLGQKENACNAYSNAAYGSFKSPAEHQMEYELKCESTTE